MNSEEQSLLRKDVETEGNDDTRCELNAAGHCITCSDEALPARVLRIDRKMQLALVMLNETTAEVDISLVEAVSPGDQLLVHGGAAIARAE
ncbi:MAG: HypC/HybG/HupF family hydrogenase formation chaperone [Ktedonobacteraceae bacterium]|nr:HypC/HybG/HupF family hydrogenase formation chaperone [Ktedonobacteraceae bacterium]